MRGLAVAGALLVLLDGGRARAEADEAAVLLDQAIQSFDDAAFGRSRELLLRAQTLARGAAVRGRVSLYLGLNAAVEGSADEARRRFREALTLDPTLRMDPERFKPELVQLFEGVRREAVGRLVVRASGAGAALWLDGERSAPLPATLDVVAGSHVVELRDAAGRTRAQRQVVVLGGQTTVVTLQLAPLVSASSRPVASGARAPARRRVWTWVAGGAAVALLGAGLGLGLSARSDHEEACDLLSGQDQECADRRRLVDPLDGPRYGELHDAVKRKELAANLCFGVAGALAVTSVVLYFLEGRTEARPAQVTLAPGGLSLSVGY